MYKNILLKYQAIWIFYDNYLNYKNLEFFLYVFFFAWFYEWLYLMQHSLNFWSYTRVIFPYRTPLLLIICFFFWLYIWGISVWRRTLFGKFTRGDRKLWAKSFASFWIVEISTLLGLFIAICWMSWGPLPLMPRYFLMQKKSFFFEITIFTYIIWLTYLLRLSMKWYLWKTQAIISSIIIVIISCLIWRDFITLYTREFININSSAKWRYIKLNNIIYSLLASWWLEFFLGLKRDQESIFLGFHEVLSSNCLFDPFFTNLNLTEYESYHWLPFKLQFETIIDPYPILFYDDNYDQLDLASISDQGYIIFQDCCLSFDSQKFYPRKIGFYPKKLAMWYFLIVLKIWHHIMLFIWWFFYILKLVTKKKSSYSFLSLCYFNIYCCFLICLFIYIFQYLPIFEGFLKIKPYIRIKLQNYSIFDSSIDYFLNLFTFNSSLLGSKYLLKNLFYNDSIFYFLNFHNKFWLENIWLFHEKYINYFGICR